MSNTLVSVANKTVVHKANLTKTKISAHINREIEAATPFDYSKPLPTLEESPFALISLAPFIKPESYTDQDREKTLAELKKSAESSGFFIISGHGIDADLIKKTHELSTNFFLNAPKEEKEALSGVSKSNLSFACYCRIE
jgi:hypothetical protein